MKSLVVYDSNFGNTKTVAQVIALELGATTCSVNDLKPDSLSGVQLLIVGSPINAWNPTKKIKQFLDSLTPGALSNIKAAAFDTRIKILISGNAAKKISRALSAKGATIMADPLGFYVKDNEGPLAEGELERAKNWSQKLTKTLS
jgi:flavodoxin